MRIRVINRRRWTFTKTAAAFIVLGAGIAGVGGLEGDDPLPSTWPFGLLALGVAGTILLTCRREDYL